MTGDIDLAITWLERELVYAQWIHDNVGGYEDILLNSGARLEYLRAAANPAIYTLTSDPTFYTGGAPALGTWLGSDVGGSETGESAVLFYIDFMDGYSVKYWVDYYTNTSPKFKAAVENNGVIELAWNIQPESTSGVERVLDASADSYIAEGLATIGKLNCTVLLRPGAEMNNWSNCDPDKFQQAFRKVANEARKYSNIKMVFSLDNVSNRNVTFSDFYPGDQYVDWIGVSTYHQTNYASINGGNGGYTLDDTRYLNDAYYGTGIYDSYPNIIFAPIARFAQEHNKPMMISECGFSCTSANGADQTAYAVDQLNKLYSYVNMVYPQVKAVFYFDVVINGSPYSYSLKGNPSLKSAYRSAIANNGGYLHQGDTTGKNWKRLDQAKVVCNQGESVKLATYAPFPGNAGTTVKYYVDGNLVSTVSSVPYNLELNTGALSSGKHTVRAEASSGQFSCTTATYEITVMAPGQMFLDVDPNAWYGDSVRWAVDRKITNGTDATSFSPDQTCTVAQILTFLYRANSSPQVTGANPFTDVSPSDYYYNAALWANQKGLVSGSSFGPSTPCTRSMVVTYLWKLAGSPKTGTASAFTDVPAELADAVAWAVEKGITTGTSTTTFSPAGICTRGQIVTFLYRAFGK